jgi:hypothetical protein
MEFVDLAEGAGVAGFHFDNFAVAQQVLTRSAAQIGFGLRLNRSSKRPYVRFHWGKGAKVSGNLAPGSSPCYSVPFEGLTRFLVCSVEG